MPQDVAVKLKKSSVAGKVPLVGNLAYGEPALNYHDGVIYYKNDSDNIKRFLDSAQTVSMLESIRPLVSVAAGRDYLSVDSNQVITLGAIDLGTDITGNLPVSHLNNGTGASSSTYLRGDMTWGIVVATAEIDSVAPTFSVGGLYWNNVIEFYVALLPESISTGLIVMIPLLLSPSQSPLPKMKTSRPWQEKPIMSFLYL